MSEQMILKDQDIREPLFDYLESRYAKVRILEEKNIGRARADLMIILPDKICGIEIKSDADSYTRLSGQVKYYDRYYDENYVVVGSTHAHHVAEHIPEYWGIISVELIKGKVDFYPVREAEPNSKAKLENKLSFLWRMELAHIQEENKLPKYSKKSKSYIVKMLLERVPKEKLHTQISEELFERNYSVF